MWPLLVLATFPCFSECFPTGAPSCSAPVPDHQPHEPQASTAPFNTSVTKLSDGSFRVKVGEESSGVLFKGFRLMARTFPEASLGTWTEVGEANMSRPIVDEEGVICGVTHVSNSTKDAIEFVFRPPKAVEVPDFRVDNFSVVVVEQFDRFWTEVEFNTKEVELSEFIEADEFSEDVLEEAEMPLADVPMKSEEETEMIIIDAEAKDEEDMLPVEEQK